MKKRIIALVLVVVMSLLALSSCGSYNFAKESLDDYTSFEYDAFMAALKNIEIEDGDFTTNTATREKLVKSKIYTTVADKIIAATKEEDRVETGKLGAGDVLYFVYYAVDEATGNVFYTSAMQESTITGTSTKAQHVAYLGDLNETDEFIKLVMDNVDMDVEIDEYIYSMLLKADIEKKAEADLKEKNPDATSDDIKNAKAEAIKVKEGDTIVISYTRSYTKPAEGDKPATPVEQKAVYEIITLTDLENNEFYKTIVNAKVNNVGSEIEISVTEEGKPEATVKEFKITEGETEYTYKNVKIEWKVEKPGKEIATFKYTPFTKDQNITPDNLREGTTKVNLKDVELTYHVFPVYAISAPVYEDITATDILTHVYGSSLKTTSLELFEDESYVKDGKTITELVQEVADIYNTKSDKYAEGNLKDLLDAYNKADSEDNDSSATTAQKEATTKAKEALEKAQKEAAAAVIANIVAASNGSETAEKVIIEKYFESTLHTMKESYDADIQEKVQEAVWKLIEKHVTVNEDAIPASLIKEFSDILYESYEYDYYTGKYNSTVTNFDQFSENGGLDAYLNYKLKANNADEVKAAIEKEAKAELVPIIKIFVVSKALKDDAEAVMPDYIKHDESKGVYEVDEQSYIDYYGEEDYKKHYKDAVKSAEDTYEYDLKQASHFIVDDAYLRAYKRNVGSAAYRQEIKDYGKTNLRVALQFNNLFYYLTSTNLTESADGDHAEVNYVTRDGVDYLDFRNVTYVLKAETTTEK